MTTVSWRGSVAALVLFAACGSPHALRTDGSREASADAAADVAEPPVDVADAPTDVAEPPVDVADALTDAVAIADGNHGDASDGGRVSAPPVWSCLADGGVGETDAFPIGATAGCAALPSCGGDPTGQWFAGLAVPSACADITTGGCALAGPAPGDACAGLAYQSGSPPYIIALNVLYPTAPTVRGATLKLVPSGDFTIDIDVTGPGSGHFAPACLTSGGNPSCAALATQLEQAGPPAKGFACLPSPAGGCDCSWTYDDAAEETVAQVGTWRAEGNLLRLSTTAPDGSAQASDYTFCVNGNVLDLTAAPGSVAFGPVTTRPGAHPFAVETLRLQRAQGTVLHWNGAAWSITTLGDEMSPHAMGGSGPADVWAGGTFAGPANGGVIAHWSGHAWSQAQVLPLAPDTHTSVVVQSVWASSPNDAWAVGSAADGSALLRWNGAAWSHVALNMLGVRVGSVFNVNGGTGAIWGSGSNDVWVGALGGTDLPIYLHFDGTGWKQVTRGTPNNYSLEPPKGLSGTGPSDAWAIEPGQSGQIVHWDGAAWSIKFIGNGTFQPVATWAGGPNDVWAIGAFGTTGQFVVGTGYVNGPAGDMIHWDGKAWSPAASGTSANLSAIWGSGPADVWAVGDDGTIVHWNGTLWSPVGSGIKDALVGIWGSGPDDIWAIMK